MQNNQPKPMLIRVDKLTEEGIKHEQRMAKLVRNEDGHILLTGGGYDYEIDKGRIDTNARLISWIHHLCGKTWVDRNTIRRLIEVAERSSGKIVVERPL